MYTLFVHTGGAPARRVCTADLIADARTIALALLLDPRTVVVVVRNRRGNFVEAHITPALRAAVA